MKKSILSSVIFCTLLTFGAIAQEKEDTCIIFVPNNASSDGDCFDCHKIRIGTNCEFSTFKFSLFDRWGNKMFETTDPTFEYAPVGLAEGTYFYSISGKTHGNASRKQTGYISMYK